MTVRQLLTPDQTSKLLAISVKQLRDLTHEGLIPFVNIGLGSKRPTRRYLPEDIELFISRRRTETQPIARNSTRATPQTKSYRLMGISEILAQRQAEKAAMRERRKKQGK